ncbi:hypothetical protein ACOQFS_19385 [Paracidovorax sp. MALMAid1276]
MNPIQEKPQKPRKGRWLIGLLVLLIAGMAYFVWRLSSVTNAFADGFQSPEMAAAQYADRTVYGELGGVLVAIPPHFAEYVEYNGDSGGGKRKGPKPVRTKESKLMSFGFDVRYPDMVGKDTSERREDYRNRKLRTTTWIRVGLGSGEIYNGPGVINRRTKNALARKLDPNQKSPWERYEKLGRNEYGLDVYVLKGNNPADGVPYRESRNAKDIFVGGDAGGHALAYIDCDSQSILNPLCQHEFDLAPKMHAYVRLIYRRGLLSEWKNIQDEVTKLVLNFAMDGQK